MSIKGFQIGSGAVQKYDYESLDNIPESFVDVDSTLTQAGDAADAKKTGDEIAGLKSAISQGSGLTEDVKQALLALLEKVAYVDDDGQDLYDALEEALYPPADLSSISAVYTQTGTITNWNILDDLKTDLVVTAHFSNGTTQTVSNYALSGSLTEGTCVITVSYGGKTTTFNVSVTHSDIPSGYTKYDYIEMTDVPTSGTAARYYTIVTDAQLDPDYTVEFDFSLKVGRSGNASFDPVLGIRDGSSGTIQMVAYIRTSNGDMKVNINGTEKTPTKKITEGVKNTVKILPVGKSQTYPNDIVIDINDVEYDTGLTSSVSQFTQGFGIFGYAISTTEPQSSTIYYRGQLIGEIKIKDSNGDLVYDFIPAKNGNDVYGFYEAIENKFWYNNYNDGALLEHYTGGNWSVS